MTWAGQAVARQPGSGAGPAPPGSGTNLCLSARGRRHANRPPGPS